LRRRRKIDIFRALQTFGGELERPRDNERDGKSDYDHEHDQSDRPIRNFKKRKDLRCNLNEQPSNNGISDRNLVNVAPLEFGEKVLKVHRLASRSLTSGERFSQGLRECGRGGSQLVVFCHEPVAELLRKGEKARVVRSRAVAKCSIQGRLMAHTK